MKRNKKRFRIIMFILGIILLYNISNRFISDNHLYNLMINNYNMKINKKHIFSKSKDSFDAPTEINAYLKKVKPKRKEYFENGRFGFSTFDEYHKDETDNLLLVVDRFILDPYVFNELLYDKSKGNNFEIVDNYVLKHINDLEIDVVYTIKSLEKEKYIYKYYFGVYGFNKDKFSYRETDKYRKPYYLWRKDRKNYFLKSKEPVDIEKMDVFSYMQNYNMYPIIKIRYKGDTKRKEEVLEKINELFIKNMNLEYVGIYVE